MQRGRVQQVAQIRQAMTQSLAMAQETAGDPELARQHYEQVLALAAEAEELRPGDAAVAELRRQSLLAMDAAAQSALSGASAPDVAALAETSIELRVLAERIRDAQSRD